MVKHHNYTRSFSTLLWITVNNRLRLFGGICNYRRSTPVNIHEKVIHRGGERLWTTYSPKLSTGVDKSVEDTGERQVLELQNL